MGRLERLSLGQVVRRLAEEGVRCQVGTTRWDRVTIRVMLTNPAYTGTARYGRARLLPRDTSRRLHADVPAVPVAARLRKRRCWSSKRRFRYRRWRAQNDSEPRRNLGSESASSSRAAWRSGFLLSGMLVCQSCGSAYCGRRLRRSAASEPCVYYRCIGTDKYRHGGEAICDNKSVNGARVEEIVWLDVCSLLQDKDRLQRELSRRLQPAAEEALDRSHWERSISQLKRRMARLIDAYENGWLDKADFEPRMRRVTERLRHEEESLAHRDQETASEEELRLLMGNFEAFADHIRDGLEEADTETRRRS